MSFQMYPHAVDLDQLRQVVGGKSRALVTKLKKRRPDTFAQVDQHLAGAEESQPTLEEILKLMLAGKSLEPAWDVQFGAVLDLLCDLYGVGPLICRPFGSPNWIHRVDRALRELCVADDNFAVEKCLVDRGPPIPFPGALDISVGYLTSSEVEMLLPRFAAADFTPLDRLVRESIAEVRSWLAFCGTMGWGLVTFYHS